MYGVRIPVTVLVLYLVALRLDGADALSKLTLNYTREGSSDFECKPAYPGLWISCKSGSTCQNYDQIYAPYFPTTIYLSGRIQPVFQPDYACQVNMFLPKQNGKNLFMFCSTISPEKPSPLRELAVINFDTSGYQMVKWKAPTDIENTCVTTYIIRQTKNGAMQWERHFHQTEPVLIGGLEPDMDYEYAVQVKPGWLSQPSDAVSVIKKTPVVSGTSPLAIELITGQPKDEQLKLTGLCRTPPANVNLDTPKLTITNALNENAQILEFDAIPSTNSQCKLGILVKRFPQDQQMVFLSKGPHLLKGLILKNTYTYDVCLTILNGECVTKEVRYSKKLEYTADKINPLWFQMTTKGSTVIVEWEIPAFAVHYLTSFNLTVREKTNIPLCPIPVTGILKYRYIFTGLKLDDQFIVDLNGYEKETLRMEVHGCSNDGKFT